MRVALEIPGESWTDLILETMGRKHVCAAALISQKWRRLPVSFPQFSASVWVSESPGVLRTTKGETQRDQYLGLPHRAARGRAAAAWVESTACPTKERDTRHFRPSQLPAVRGVPQRTQACGEQGPCWPVSVPGPLSGMQLLLPSAGHSQGPEGSTARPSCCPGLLECSRVRDGSGVRLFPNWSRDPRRLMAPPGRRVLWWALPRQVVGTPPWKGASL